MGYIARRVMFHRLVINSNEVDPYHCMKLLSGQMDWWIGSGCQKYHTCIDTTCHRNTGHSVIDHTCRTQTEF